MLSALKLAIETEAETETLHVESHRQDCESL